MWCQLRELLGVREELSVKPACRYAIVVTSASDVLVCKVTFDFNLTWMGKTKLNTSQKQQVGQFQGITGASKEQAAQCLQSSQWNVELAINFFFNQGLTASTSNDNSAITSLYEKYRDKQEDAILADGAEQLLNCGIKALVWK